MKPHLSFIRFGANHALWLLMSVSVLLLIASVGKAQASVIAPLMGCAENGPFSKTFSPVIGEKDKGISGGAISMIQTLIDEPDIRNRVYAEQGKWMTHGLFDETTKRTLILWQIKQGVISTSTDTGAGSVGPRTLGIFRRFCEGQPTIVLKAYLPIKRGGFAITSSDEFPKYTSKTADLTLQALLGLGIRYYDHYDKSSDDGKEYAYKKDGTRVLVHSENFVFDPFSAISLDAEGFHVTANNLTSLQDFYLGVTQVKTTATIHFAAGARVFFDSDAGDIIKSVLTKTLKILPGIKEVIIDIAPAK